MSKFFFKRMDGEDILILNSYYIATIDRQTGTLSEVSYRNLDGSEDDVAMFGEHLSVQTSRMFNETDLRDVQIEVKKWSSFYIKISVEAKLPVDAGGLKVNRIYEFKF